MKTLRLIGLMGLMLAPLPLSTGGCAHTASILKAIGDNTNSLKITVTTLSGNVTIERNLPYRLTLTP